MVFSKCPRNIELVSLIWSWIPLLSRFCDLGFKLVVYYVTLVYRCLEGIHTTMVEVVVVGTVCFKLSRCTLPKVDGGSSVGRSYRRRLAVNGTTTTIESTTLLNSEIFVPMGSRIQDLKYY